MRRAAVARITPFALGAVVVAGIAVALVPQHAASILRLLAATVAACAVLVVVVAAIGEDLDPTADRRAPSPLDRPAVRTLRPMAAPGLTRARRAVADDVLRHRGDVTRRADVAAATDRLLHEGNRP